MNYKEEASRCLLCHEPPCSKACPANTDPGKFIRSLRFNNLKGAVETIRENNPLGAICAHICPTEKYCEGACSRCGIDRPIQIAALQAYLTEYESAIDMNVLQKVVQHKAKIAIIGSGPSGLSAASFLAREGFSPTLFEKNATLGGWLSYGIPDLRLDPLLVENEINRILKLGVDYQTHCTFGIDETVSSLKEKGYKAILIATGCTEPKVLDMFKGYDNVQAAVHFLATAKLHKGTQDKQLKNVLVIGGGDVAMDVALTAKAMGAKQVRVIAPEDLCHFPASPSERRRVQDCYVSIIDGFKPLSFDGQTVHFESCVDASQLSIKPDTIILAIGQQVAKLANLETIQNEDSGYIHVVNYQTHIPTLFASGDCIEGEQTVAYAIKTGKEAARAISTYFGGESSC